MTYIAYGTELFKKIFVMSVFIFLIEIWLIYNAVLVFDIQQSDLAIYIYVLMHIHICVLRFSAVKQKIRMFSKIQNILKKSFECFFFFFERQYIPEKCLLVLRC